MPGERKARFAGAVTAALLMVLGILAVPAPASAAPVTLSDQLTTEEGSTDALGGGDHFFIKFGTDAAFGIVWGTDDNPNNVYFVSIVSRYLGYAQIYDSDAKLVEEDHAVKVYTMYAVKLDGMLEFDDVNGNGLLPYLRYYDEATNAFTAYAAGEPIFKKVNFKTAWTSTPVEYAEGDDVRTWSFNLTAADLPYSLLEDASVEEVGDNVLNEVTLTFHLEARAVQVDNATIPQWRVTMTRGPFGGMMWFSDLERMEDIQVTGDVVAYHVKWDKEIIGWDYDPTNENPTLLMEFGTIVGNYIPGALLRWMEMYQYRMMIANMHESGSMHCESTTGDVDVNETTGSFASPRPLTTPRLTFGGENTRIGRLEWVSNVTVDGEQGLVHAQIMAGHRVTAVGANGALFTGFIALGAMTFPGGEVILHDPTFSAEALVDVTTDAGPVFPLFLAAVIGSILGIVIIAVLISMIREKPGRKPQNIYERSASVQQNDWSRYYSKK